MDNVSILEELTALRKRVIKEDIEKLRDAAHVLEREGRAFQHDLYTRLNDYLDEMDSPVNPLEEAAYIPKQSTSRGDAETAAAIYEQRRKGYYEKVNLIRNKISCEKTKRALYTMTWEIPDSDLESLLLLYREGMARFHQRHKNIFTEPPGIREIQYNLAKLGIVEVVPQQGDEFDPVWHLHSNRQKTGFDYHINKTIHPGYKRNNRRLLKAIVEVF